MYNFFQLITFFLLSRLSPIASFECLQQRHAGAEIVRPHERRRIGASRREVSDAIVGSVMLAFAVGIPIDSDPIAAVTLHGPHVPDCSDSSRLPQEVYPLPDPENVSGIGHGFPGRVAGVGGGLHLQLEKWSDD